MVAQRIVTSENQNRNLEVEGHKFKRIQQFKYIVALLTIQKQISSGIKARI